MARRRTPTPREAGDHPEPPALYGSRRIPDWERARRDDDGSAHAYTGSTLLLIVLVVGSPNMSAPASFTCLFPMRACPAMPAGASILVLARVAG